MPVGEEPDCAEQAEASSPHAIDPAGASELEAEATNTVSPHAVKAAEAEPARHGNAAAGVKPRKQAKSKKARSRGLPPFLRKVDTFLSQRR